jgi:hypothetical protein
MRHTLAAGLLAVTALLARGAVGAPMKEAQVEPAKHLTLVELYVRGARDGAKALQLVTMTGETPADATLIDELATRTLDQVTKAETHLRHLEKLQANVSKLRTHMAKLREAGNRLAVFHPRSAALTIKDRSDLQVATEHITAHANDALRRIDRIANDLGHATLDEVEVRERNPVRGD